MPQEQRQAGWGGEQGCGHECVMRAFQRLLEAGAFSPLLG